MVKVEIFRNLDGNISFFQVKGHAGSDKYGKDIVCSAISALAQTAIIGLEKVADIRTNYDIKEGNLKCRIPKQTDDVKSIKAQAILETMSEGIKSIKDNYKEFIDIVEKEEV